MKQNNSILRIIPNVLTSFRSLAAIVLPVIIVYGGEIGALMAAPILILAGISDYFDGFYARKYSVTSNFGKILDPVADKIIVTVALLLMIHDGKIDGFHFYAAVIIIAREVLVSGLREYLAKLQVSLPVTQLSKVKTFIQMFSISVLLSGEPGNLFLLGYGTMIGILGLWISTIISVQTGYVYTVKCLKHT